MDLLDAMKQEYSASKRWLRNSLILTAAFSVCSLAGSLVSVHAAAWFAISAFILQILIVVFRAQSTSHYRLAESVRRPAMLLSGLNRQPPPSDVRLLAARLGVADTSGEIGPQMYYASKLPFGPERLLEIIEECAFWTADLAARTGKLLKVAFGIACALMIVALYAAINTGVTTNYRNAAAKILLAFATSLFVGDLFQLMQQYTDLAAAAQRVMNQCQTQQSRADCNSLGESMAIADEYNCALVDAPTIPEFVYQRNRKRLNDAWAAQCNL